MYKLWCILNKDFEMFFFKFSGILLKLKTDESPWFPRLPDSKEYRALPHHHVPPYCHVICVIFTFTNGKLNLFYLIHSCFLFFKSFCIEWIPNNVTFISTI